MGYSIGEMSERTGLSAHTLRYYEKEGLLFDVGRKPSGLREYTDKDLEMVEVVRCLKGAGMGIAEIKRYIALFKGGAESFPQRAELFDRQCGLLEEKIAELEAQLAMARYKRWYYRNVLDVGDLDDPLNCLRMRELYEREGYADDAR